MLGEMTNTDMGTDDTGPYVMEAEWWNKQGLGEVGGGFLTGTAAGGGAKGGKAAPASAQPEEGASRGGRGRAARKPINRDGRPVQVDLSNSS